MNSQRLSRPAKPQDGKRLELPWVAVQKDYEFDTEDGKSLADLFEGRSQLLAYSCVPMASIGWVRSMARMGSRAPVMPSRMVPPVTASHPPAGM